MLRAENAVIPLALREKLDSPARQDLTLAAKGSCQDLVSQPLKGRCVCLLQSCSLLEELLVVFEHNHLRAVLVLHTLHLRRRTMGGRVGKPDGLSVPRVLAPTNLFLQQPSFLR